MSTVCFIDNKPIYLRGILLSTNWRCGCIAPVGHTHNSQPEHQGTDDSAVFSSNNDYLISVVDNYVEHATFIYLPLFMQREGCY